MLITNNYDNMRNANKTVIHVPKLRSHQYLILFYNRWLTIYKFHWSTKIIERKESFALAKKTLKC